MLLVAITIAGCSFSGPPHSDYFVLTFAPGGLDLTPEGKEALANASRSAPRGSAVLIRGVASAATDPRAQGLIRRREKAVTDALIAVGVPPGALRVDNRTVGDQEFARRADTLTIQVMFGAAPPS